MANQIDTDAKVMTGNDYGFGHPAICRLSNTVMLAAHINQSDELEIHKSTNNGVNWTLKKTLSNATGCFNIIPMTSTKAGLVYQKNNNEFEVWVTTDAGENWTDKLDMTTQISASDKSILLYDNNIGRLHFIYMSTAGGGILGKYSNNDGDNWTNWAGSIIADGNLADADINLLNNYIYISYFYGATSNNYYKHFNSIGTYVGTSGNLGFAGRTYHDKNLVIDSLGNRYFIYVQRWDVFPNNEILYVRKNEGLGYILGGQVPNYIIKGSVSIGIDEDDNVYVFYTKTSDEKTYYRKYNAGITTWEVEVELIGVANNRINTEKHVLSGSNKLHFVYYKAP